MADQITTEQMSEVHKALGGVQKWAHNCHAASHAIVQARIFPAARVARGFAHGLVGQHSWVVVGDNVYSPEWVIDPTLWSYTGRLPQVDYVPGATSRSAGYVPHGAGSIFQSHMPSSQGGDPIELAGDHSPEVENFLRLLGPLDLRGWVKLFHCPVESGWPAREIITAAYRQDIFRAFIPVDIVGNLTDENPGGLYLPTTTTTKERERGIMSDKIVVDAPATPEVYTYRLCVEDIEDHLGRTPTDTEVEFIGKGIDELVGNALADIVHGATA